MKTAHEANPRRPDRNSLRLPRGVGRAPLQTALQSIVLAARAAGIAVFDGVYNQIDDLDGFAAEAAEATPKEAIARPAAVVRRIVFIC